MRAEPLVELVFGSLVAASLLSARQGIRVRTSERLFAIARGTAALVERSPGPSRSSPLPAARWLLSHPKALAICGAVIGGFVVDRLAGTIGVPLGAVLGAAAPWSLHRREARRRAETLERQLAEVVEAVALSVRSGLALNRALAFAAGEASPPMSDLLEQVMGEQALGTPFEVAIEHFADRLPTDDARLFVLVMTVHGKSGGNLAGALDEVVRTIRHRISVRRDLRALSAQGRISGTVLGSLPVGFFLVLASTSHRELAPVYRSGAGAAMVVAGLLMQALAYLWIRRLMKVQI